MPDEMTSENSEYLANDADAIVSEIFSGELPTGEAIERLRTRLLDLSPRNRLLNYRHPKGRCIQICNEPIINLVFDRLFVDGKSVPLKPVPEPDPKNYEGKRLEAKLHAPSIGISTLFEFPPNKAGSQGHRLHALQTLYYPPELERQLRKIASEAKTAIEETGTNMLFLMFGFLESYDSEDSERPMLSPLIALPVALTREQIDTETRTFQYSMSYNGEDLGENHTLREKLRRDFTLSLPEFEEEEEPEAYFDRIERAVRTKRRWRVRRQITLGMLSFGKLAIWADLDTKKNPGVTTHPLLQSLFSGVTGDSSGEFHAEDYHIDSLPEAAQQLIYDADSSQHSAIIDVLSGKNTVINGPPGTGKSQTITNVIASALSQGKKVLFVSEKLAALEVVRHRLNQASLGHFCLELHSHKTQKKKFLEDVEARINENFPPPAQYQTKLAALQRRKTELARYAELIGSRVGNGLGLTVHEVFWAAENRRQGLGDLSAAVNSIAVPNASEWTYDDLEIRSARISALAKLHDEIGRVDEKHPWWGFHPSPLAPSDDEAIGRVVFKALGEAEKADCAATEAIELFGLLEQPNTDAAAKTRALLDEIPPIPATADLSLLPRMFDPVSDPKGQRSSRLLAEIASGIGKARNLIESASGTLADGKRLPCNEVSEMEISARLRLSADLLSVDTAKALELVAKLEKAVSMFCWAAKQSAAPYGAAGKATIDVFLANAARVHQLEFASSTLIAIALRSSIIKDTAERLSTAHSKVSEIAIRWDLLFDSTPDAVVALADPACIPGLVPGILIDEMTLADATRLVNLPFADKSLEEIKRSRDLLSEETTKCSEALARCRTAVERLGIAFDSTEQGVAEAAILARLSADAPVELLEYRQPTFGQSRTKELAEKAGQAIREERNGRAAHDQLFYLDTLPSISALEQAVTTLRHKDGLFAFFDGEWRKARKLHSSLCRERRRIDARKRASELSNLIAWIKKRNTFLTDPEYKQCFGGLFCGLNTDIDKISRLNDWYVRSRAALAECPGLTDKVDLTTLAAERISEMAAKFTSLTHDAVILARLEEEVRKILDLDLPAFRTAKTEGWSHALASLQNIIKTMDYIIDFFTPRAVSRMTPRGALRMMEARSELDAAASDLELLRRGEAILHDAAGVELRKLVESPVADWRPLLARISADATLVAETIKQAESFASSSVPFSNAVSFAAAKAELDAAWSCVASLVAWDRFVDWAGYSGAASMAAVTGREVLERFAYSVRPQKSLDAVFKAYSDEAEAESIFSQFARSDDVRQLLGDMFEGADTDLIQLADTHAWGDAVCILKLPLSIRNVLLSADAATMLKKARTLYRDVETGTVAAQASVEGLNSFGSISWDEWQRQARSAFGRDAPSEIRMRLETAAGNLGAVLPWSKYLSLREDVRQDGLGDLVLAVESRKIPSAFLDSAFELAAYHSIGRSIYQRFPEFSRFNGTTHERTRADYRALDAEIISITGKAFAYLIDRNKHVPEGQRGAVVADYTEMHLLRREISKQRRHIPIRQLVKRAGRALQELKPCFMMGPLSVAQYLEQGALHFDLVVMDEASQLRPEEALGAIVRGTQLVVVGDPKQLPPTSFFDRMLDSGDEDEDEACAAISGMESILDICQQLFTPVRSLRWHYRSHHESLIAFSNHHFYKNLIVFPSPYAKKADLGVKYRFVKGGSYRGRQNIPEAQRVVDAALEHMIKRPDESLGIVTLNQTQRELIEELLDRKLRTFAEGGEFLGRWEAEGWPLFVKNLENVQGDERDVIFISTTFGKAPGTDIVRQNFGPISRPDGWRRLNVLFTRARLRVELFTSMLPEDIITDERTPLGTKALRDYLDFAKRGVLVTTDESDREPDSDFELAVANVIESKGYEVKPQLGVAGFFIDMAVRNPDRPGEFLAGIECDGATYHSGSSVRDRDRIRQMILESLGWKNRIYRIWSTDWFYNPRRETAKLIAFLEERRRLSQAEPPSDWEEDETISDQTVGSVESTVVMEEPSDVLSTSTDEGDFFVEVGDSVTFCYVDDPSTRRKVLIIDGDGNPNEGIINEQAPMAQALLGLSLGEVGNLNISGKKSRQLKVLKVQRG